MVAHPHERRTEPGLQADCAEGALGPLLLNELRALSPLPRGPAARRRPTPCSMPCLPGHADLPSMRVIFVPHTGQVPWAADLPLGRSFFSPSNSRLVRHLTQ